MASEGQVGVRQRGKKGMPEKVESVAKHGAVEQPGGVWGGLMCGRGRQEG